MPGAGSLRSAQESVEQVPQTHWAPGPGPQVKAHTLGGRCVGLVWAGSRWEELTNEGHSLSVNDATGQQVEIILLAVYHHGMPGVVASLGKET